MSTAVNYCSSDLGAKIVEFCSNSANAEGILSEREESIWSAKAEGVVEKPFVTIQLPPHPAIRFVGWHVWQDYGSNPKVVEVSAGMSPNALTDVVHCTALQGPGIQLWELSTPISSAYSYIRFRVVATFGSASTYMNRVFAFSQRPPEPSTASAVGITGNFLNNSSYSPQSRLMMRDAADASAVGGIGIGIGMNQSSFSPTQLRGYNYSNNNHNFNSASAPGAMLAGPSASNPRGFSHSSSLLYNNNNNNNSVQDATGSTNNPMKAFEAGSPMHMSEMLRELDDDIRLLHPLHVEGLVAKTAAAASKTSTISGRPTPTVSPTNPNETNSQNMMMIADYSFNNSNNNNSNNLRSSQQQQPLQQSEIEELRREIAELKGRVSRSSTTSPHNAATTSAAASFVGGGGGGGSGRVSFPQEELASLVDDIVQPKLMKWARKLETRILMKVDETLKDLLGQITAAIDGRVEQHMRHVLREHHREHGIELCHLCGPHHFHTHGSSLRKSSSASSTIKRSSAAAAPLEEDTNNEGDFLLEQEQQPQQRRPSSSMKSQQQQSSRLPPTSTKFGGKQ